MYTAIETALSRPRALILVCNPWQTVQGFATPIHHCTADWELWTTSGLRENPSIMPAKGDSESIARPNFGSVGRFAALLYDSPFCRASFVDFSSRCAVSPQALGRRS